MSDIPKDLHYTQSHEWVADNGDGTLTVGITEHAQSSLGDLVFVELPEVGDQYAAEDTVATLESVKAASDLYAPVDGEIVEINEALADAPEQINEDPYGQGWLFKLSVDDPAALDGLLDADGYAAVVEADED